MMISRRLLIPGIVLALAVLLLLAVWLRPADEAWARLQRGETLRVAVDPSFPPFDNLDQNGQLEGFDVDLARELGDRLGAPVEFKTIAFDGLVDAILAGKVDVVISAFPLDPRLRGDVRYSRPYFDGGLALVVRENSPLLGPADLVGRRVAVEWGGLGDAWARAHDLAPQRLETANEALAAVASGDAEAAIVDAVSYAQYSNPGLVLRLPLLESDPYVIVLPPTAVKLTEAIDTALAGMMADGSWQALAEQHFAQPPPLPVAPKATPAPR